MSGIAIILGLCAAFVGALLGEGKGLLLGGVLGYLGGAYFDISRTVNELQKTLARLVSQIGGQQPAVPEETTGSRSTEDSVAVMARPEKSPVSDSLEAEVVYAQPQHAQSAPTITAGAGISATTDSSTDLVSDKLNQVYDWVVNFFTTGNVVVRIGLVVLFFGVAFLLKYAAEHSLLPIELRLTSVALGGIIMLVIGWRLRERRRGYALLIQGGAVGVIYLTLFSAARFYDFIPPGLAFGLMLALVVLSAILALLQDAKALALFGAAGGFLAPVLTSTGGGSHVMLFSYYLLLNFGILFIAWYRAWRELNLLGFLFTFVIGVSWGLNYYRPENFASTEPFLVAFFVIFVAVSVLFAHRQPPQFKGYVDSTLVFGVPIVAFALQASLVHEFEYGMAWSAAGLGAFYLGLATLLWKRQPGGLRLLTEAFLALGVVFATLVIPFALEGEWTAAAWALEGAAMIWIGVKQQRLLARLFALLLQAGAGVIFLLEVHGISDSIPVLNGIFLGSLAISLAGLFSAYYLQAHRQRLIHWEYPVIPALFIWGCLWWYLAGIHEVLEHTPARYENSLLLLVFAASSALAYFIHRRLHWKMIYYPVLALLPLAVVILVKDFSEARFTHPFADFGYVGWLTAIGFFYSQLWQQDRQEKPLWLLWQHRVIFWLGVLVLTLEATWVVEQLVEGAGTWSFIMWGVVPALSLKLASGSAGWCQWPVARHYADYLGIISLPLLGAIMFWSVIASLHVAGDPWPLRYLPVLNPLDLAELFVFLTIIQWFVTLRRHQKQIIYKLDNDILFYGLGVIIFIWLNGVIARTIHHWTGLRFDWYVMFNSMLFHATISVVWTLLAMTIAVIASRIRHRKLWFIGAGLLGIVVGKLFLVDLANSGTIERIVSFMVVGIIMLLIGYFSPLPPQQTMERAE